MTCIVRVLDGPLDVQPLVRELTRPECGAVLTFHGVVRDHADGKDVAAIDYTCYAAMAEAELRRVVEAAMAEHGVPHVAVLHRVGRLEVGEASLAMVVASPHRREAFACAQAIIDELKRTVPIWKKEHGPDGSWWV